MGLESYITDPSNHKKAHIVTHNNISHNNGIVVATHPLNTYENTLQFFTSNIYGIDMNISISVDETENVHNGLDNVYWTASVVVGKKWTISSGDQANTGVSSIKYDDGDAGDTLQIDRGSDITLTDYDFIVMFIYIEKNWATEDSISIYGWDTGTGTKVRNSVNLEDFFSSTTFKVWHKISIPLSSLGLIGETLDSIRIEINTVSGKSPKFYMDDIRFEGLIGETGEFIIKPEIGTWLHVHNISVAIADNIEGTVTDGTMPGLSYNKLLGENALSNGIIFQTLTDVKITGSLVIRQLSDFLEKPGTIIYNQISDGTNTFITVLQENVVPQILKSEERNSIKITISDDLSGLLLLRASISGKIERRK